MLEESQLSGTIHVIQLAVAPVFLLTGIGSLLGAFSTRVGRIIDRARVLEKELVALTVVPPSDPRRRALKRLASRARWIYWAMAFLAGGALLISAMIVLLFVGVFADLRLSIVVAGLFVGALACVMCGLLCFLREVYLATRYLRIGEFEVEERPIDRPAQIDPH
jgi:hypothetical protein